jgi:protein TonB
MSREIFPLFGNRVASFVGSSAVVSDRPNFSLASALKPASIKERSARMLILLFSLVLTLHLCGAIWFAQSAPVPIPSAKPLKMEVSVVKLAAPKPVIPPASAAASIKAPPRKKPQPKPKLNTPPRVEQAPAAFAPTEQVVEQAPPVPAVNPSESAVRAKTDAAPISEPDYSANYAHNPAPEYPAMARSRGWQGKVLLRVLVSAEGLSETVAVDQSSGYEILDESAVEAVKKWLFTPAMQGNSPLASTVLVPIIFALRD